MKIVLLGAPGSGKGTLAQGLIKHFNIPSISTGDLLRQSISSGTEVGKKAKAFMDEGKLVPTDIVLEMLVERLKNADTKHGYILDGFPRTIEQAKLLEKIVKVDKVVMLNVDKGVIVNRIAGRITCKKCGKIYNKSWYKQSHCECGGELYVRDDDNPETVAKRFDTYVEQTEPLVDYYKKKGLLVTVEGQDNPDDTLKLALEQLR